MNLKILKSLGLNELEIESYIILIKEQNIKASELAELLNIHRTSAYDLLDRLIDKGFCCYTIVTGNKVFHPTDPKRILFEFREKEELVSRLIKEIEKLNIKKKVKSSFEVYEGLKGIKSIWESKNFHWVIT